MKNDKGFIYRVVFVKLLFLLAQIILTIFDAPYFRVVQQSKSPPALTSFVFIYSK
jgi:hypothetical protein